MKIREEELLDYIDGTLDPSRHADVEAHLAQDAEVAALLSDMPHAMDALRDWSENEPASTRDLWPQIREQLPARAGSPIGRMLPRPARKSTIARESKPSLANALFGAQSAWRVSARVAMVAVFVALAAFLFSPRKAIDNASAEQLTPAEQTFIQQSVQRHAAYETVRSVNGATVAGAISTGDGRSSDGEDDEPDTTDDPYSP